MACLLAALWDWKLAVLFVLNSWVWNLQPYCPLTLKCNLLQTNFCKCECCQSEEMLFMQTPTLWPVSDLPLCMAECCNLTIEPGLTPNVATLCCSLKLLYPVGCMQISQVLHDGCWSRHLLRTEAGPTWLKTPWRYEKLKTWVNNISYKSCLALAQKVGQIFYVRYLNMCCSSHECMFFTNVASFKREIDMFFNSIRFVVG